MDVVYPKSDAVLMLPSGASFTVRMGQHWPADDPIVRAHPDHFTADPRYGLCYSFPPPEMAEPPVEAATANPGEKRAYTRRIRP